MSIRENDIAVLRMINQSLGFKCPMADCMVSDVYTAENLSFDIKRKAYHGIEVFHECINKVVSDYFKFERSYREAKHITTIENLKRLQVELVDKPIQYKEKLRWNEDMDKLIKQRQPITHVYTGLFGGGVKGMPTQTNEEDFMVCCDFAELAARLPSTQLLGSVAQLLVGDKPYERLKKHLDIISELTKAVTEMSNDYERLFQRYSKIIDSNGDLSNLDRIDLAESTCTVLGVVIRPYICEVLNKRWYNTRNNNGVGNSHEDVKVMLQALYKDLAPNGANEANSLSNLLTLTKVESAQDVMRNLQRSCSELMTQIELSSNRLLRLGDYIRETPSDSGDDASSVAMRDLSVLIAIYAGSLFEVAKFTNTLATRIDESYTSIEKLTRSIDTLHTLVSHYIANRKNNEKLQLR